MEFETQLCGFSAYKNPELNKHLFFLKSACLGAFYSNKKAERYKYNLFFVLTTRVGTPSGPRQELASQAIEISAPGPGAP